MVDTEPASGPYGGPALRLEILDAALASVLDGRLCEPDCLIATSEFFGESGFSTCFRDLHEIADHLIELALRDGWEDRAPGGHIGEHTHRAVGEYQGRAFLVRPGQDFPPGFSTVVVRAVSASRARLAAGLLAHAQDYARRRAICGSLIEADHYRALSSQLAAFLSAPKESVRIAVGSF